MSLIRRLFVDLETSPNVVYSWRIGRKIDLSHDNIVEERRIITICYKWEGKDKVHSLTWGKDRGDKAMLKQFLPVLMEAQEVIAHNGDRFDLPWIRTRCLFHGINIPAQLPSVDTLKMARKGFMFNSNRLDYLGGFMGHGHKKETGGFGLWKKVIAGNAGALREMVSYCKRDVELLEKVHGSLYGYSVPKTHLGVLAGGYKHHCPRCASDNVIMNGNRYTTLAGTVLVQMHCKDCSRKYRMSQNVVMREQLREHEAKELAAGRR